MAAYDLTGKTVLITGATDGLGRALAREVLDAGATVLVHGRSPERIEATVDELDGGGAPATRLVASGRTRGSLMGWRPPALRGHAQPRRSGHAVSRFLERPTTSCTSRSITWRASR